MVGIPGKSKGCHTCRRRRVKCDEGKPDCQKCLRGGRECEGYERRPVFLNRTAEGLSKRRHLEEAAPRGEGGTSGTSSGSKSASSPSPSSSSSDDDSRQVCGLELDAVPREYHAFKIKPIASPRTRYVLLRGLEGYFHQKFVPYPWRNETGLEGTGNWMVSILSLADRTPALDNSLCALIAVQAGKDQGNDDLLRFARTMYSRGLYYMQEAIQDDQLALSDQTLAAVNCLKAYELQEATSNSPSGFNAHAKGLEQLIIRRGTRDWESALGRQVLFEAAFSSMIIALQYCNTSPLGKYSWLGSSEWTNAMDVHFSLIEIGYQLAASIESFASLIKLPKGAVTSKRAKEVSQRAVKARDNFEQWHGRLIQNVDLAMDWPRASAAPTQPAVRSTPARRVQLSALHQSLIMLDWWIMRCMVWRIVTMSRALLPPLVDDGDLASTNDFFDPLQCVENIIQVAPYLLEEENGMYCSRRVIMPLRFALEICKMCGTERGRACQKILGGMLDFTVHKRGLRHGAVIRSKSGGWEYFAPDMRKHLSPSAMAAVPYIIEFTD